MPPLEYCQLCNSETGRAGRSDDSIYLEIPHGDEIGPLCEECYSAFGKAMEACKKDILEMELNAVVTQLRAGA